jgi:hypothetical protein
MPKAWSAKRERQYKHIKDSVLARGEKESTAEEIAARTLNKERAQHGEARQPNPHTLRDEPAPVRGGERSHRGAAGRTREQLYEEARARGITGRSSMNKEQFLAAVGRD